jgi:hypothetical protein
MAIRITTHSGHGPSTAGGLSPGLRRGLGRPSAAAPPTSEMHRGAGDRTPDGRAPKVDASCRLGMQWLDLTARLGLSLFIAAGVAAAWNMYADRSLSSPNMIRACEGSFFWSLAFTSWVRSRHPGNSPVSPAKVSDIIARRSAPGPGER